MGKGAFGCRPGHAVDFCGERTGNTAWRIGSGKNIIYFALAGSKEKSRHKKAGKKRFILYKSDGCDKAARYVFRRSFKQRCPACGKKAYCVLPHRKPQACGFEKVAPYRFA